MVNYPILLFLFNIGPYDHQKSPQKTKKNFKNSMRRKKKILGGHNMYPWIPMSWSRTPASLMNRRKSSSRFKARSGTKTRQILNNVK